LKVSTPKSLFYASLTRVVFERHVKRRAYNFNLQSAVVSTIYHLLQQFPAGAQRNSTNSPGAQINCDYFSNHTPISAGNVEECKLLFLGKEPKF
jgi:hypothetical protein